MPNALLALRVKELKVPFGEVKYRDVRYGAFAECA